jgi:predicted CXXCH cytochrome family protein
MVPRGARIVVLVIMLTGMSCLPSVMYADEATNALLPVIPMGQGESCVKDTDFMRRNHMELLKHQRDETTLRGVREEQYSLKECLNCHAVYGPDATAVTSADPRHFCRSCHDYAAVSIDCFQCHASRPEIN